MEHCFNQSHIIHQIPREKYIDFCSQLKAKVTNCLSLQMFNNENICNLTTELCGNICDDEIKSVLLLLNENKIGMAVLDVPDVSCFSEKENAIFGAGIVSGIFNNIGVANTDPINKMPFVIHTASHSNEQKIDSKGLEKSTPEMKLGFHNDGLLSDTKVEIPHHIMVYNFYIGYRNPGNFIWVPIGLWDEAEIYQQMAKNNKIVVKIKLMPNYHSDKKGDIINTISDYVEVPLISINEQGEYRFFLNGKVLPEDNPQAYVDFVHDMRYSLEKNSVKICIPQKDRRAFFIKNTMGFHARNIFEDPVEGVDLTRVYLRAVDTNTEFYAFT